MPKPNPCFSKKAKKVKKPLAVDIRIISNNKLLLNIY